jgi:hypothetical protein
MALSMTLGWPLVRVWLAGCYVQSIDANAWSSPRAKKEPPQRRGRQLMPFRIG